MIGESLSAITGLAPSLLEQMYIDLARCTTWG